MRRLALIRSFIVCRSSKMEYMLPAPEQKRDTILPSPGSSDEGSIPFRSLASRDDFLWRQLTAAGLAAIAEKIAAGHDLELEEALALSRVSLPLLGKLVQLRSITGDAGDTPAAGALPIDRAATPPALRPGIGQGLTDWEAFCPTLIAIRGELSPSRNASLDAAANFWYPIVEQPMDGDAGCNGNITGADVLRAIALARLVLPAAIEVRAPLATLGPKVAQVALEFGASHLGCVAPQGQTPNDPLIADPGLLDELMESCVPTNLKP